MLTENNWIFSYEEYGHIKWTIETTWEKSIEMCLQLTEQLEKKWTRREGIMARAYNGSGIYCDIYNEGAIQLIQKKDYKDGSTKQAN